MEDLGLIEWRKANTPARASLYPYRLPSKASAVIVKYRPRIAISCVIPPQRFEASYRLGSRNSRKRGTEEIVTPILLMTQTIAEMPSSIRTRGVVGGYSLWALQLQEGALSKTKEMNTSPYLFGNVWEKGAICFGGLAPLSLMQAFNYYWSSGFNDELFHDKGNHVCNNKSHHYGDSHTGCRCERKYEHDCLCSRKTAHSHSNCGCTSVVESKKCKGSCLNRVIMDNPNLKDLYKITMLTFSMQGFPFSGTEITEASEAVWRHWQVTLEESRRAAPTRLMRRGYNSGHCMCCISISTMLDRAKRKAHIKGKSLGPRQLSKHAVVDNEPYPGCGCEWRHKNTCNCSMNRCQCPCVCQCCLKTCGHKSCSCNCCLGKCNCNCSCSNSTKFKEHLVVYHDKILPNQPWKDRTTLICGEAYWASPSTSSAVLVTNHPYLLMRIPEKYRRKMASGSGVIALGKEGKDGCWEFNSGTYKFQVPSSLVTAN